jgi:hypothetical protein
MHIPEFANPFNDKTHDDIAIIMSVLVEKANAGATLTTTGGQRAVLRARTLQQLSIHRLSSDARRMALHSLVCRHRNLWMACLRNGGKRVSCRAD